jgi:hypothetical protein
LSPARTGGKLTHSDQAVGFRAVSAGTGFANDSDITTEGALAHLDNVGQLFDEALKIVELTRLEIHGPEGELAKLREPLAKLNPQFFILECGFRR